MQAPVPETTAPEVMPPEGTPSTASGATGSSARHASAVTRAAAASVRPRPLLANPRLPLLARREALLVGGAGALYFTGLAVARQLGWYPLAIEGYVVLGVLALAVVVLARRLPVTAIVVAGVYAVGVQVGFARPILFVPLELVVVPLLLACFVGIVSGARLAIALPVFGALAVIAISPVIWLMQLVALWRLGWVEAMSYSTAMDRSDQALLLVLSAVTAVLAVTLRRQRLVAEQLRERNAELESLRAREAVRIAAEERTAIAREIHDVVAHHIAALVIQAQAAVRIADTQPENLRESVEQVAASGQDALTAMRQVVRVLRAPAGRGDPAEQADLGDAMDTIVSRVRDAGLTVDYRLDGQVALPPVTRAAVIRIVQESLTNVMLHSRASAATVAVAVDDDGVRVTVDDAGPAGERLPDATGGGTGLVTMAERARTIGGRLDAGPATHGSGWRVDAHLPLTAPGQAADPR